MVREWQRSVDGWEYKDEIMVNSIEMCKWLVVWKGINGKVYKEELMISIMNSC